MMAAHNRKTFDNNQPPMRRDSQLLPSSSQHPLPHGMSPLGHLSHSNLAPHPQMRPEMSRAVSYPIPTPPSSASGIMGGSENFHWNQPSMMGNSGSAPLAIDTVINTSRSMPTTPATTPPGGALQQLQQYNTPNNFNEPRSSPIYSSQGQSMPQGTVSQSGNMNRFGPPLPQPPYMSQPRDNMPPPTSRGPNVSRPSSSQNNADGQVKDDNGIEQQQGSLEEEEQDNQEEEADHEPEHEYDSNVNQYNNVNGRGYFQPGDTPHLSPDMTGSPNHQGPGTPNRSLYGTPNVGVSRNMDNGGSTPRTAGTGGQQWVPQSGYSTPPRGAPNASGVRGPAPARNIYNTMINDGADRPVEPTNGTASDTYGQHGMGVPVTPNQTQSFGGLNGSNKRIREMDDQETHGSRPSSRGDDDRGNGDDGALKRRKTISNGSAHPAPASSNFDNRDATARTTQLNRARSTTANPRRGR